MINGWTAGQAVLLRLVLGAWLCLHFAQLAPWSAELFSSAGVIPNAADSPLLLPVNALAWCDSPWFATALTIAASAAGLALALGVAPRIAAVLLWYVSACLLGRNPLILNPGLPYVGWMLLAIAWTPRARLGDAEWRLPNTVFALAWGSMVVGYAYSAWTKVHSVSWVQGEALRFVLENPLARPGWLRDALLASPTPILRLATWGTLGLEMLAPLALWRPLRPWLWSALLAMHLGLMVLLAFPDLSMGMVMLHLFTFDPAWLAPIRRPAVVFYDGGCGLCHRVVTFCLGEDRCALLRFAPLNGDAFASLPEDQRHGLGDSIVVRVDEGPLLQRSRAIAAVLDALGGAWRVAALLVRATPRPAADVVYDLVAGVRRRMFQRPMATCPMVAPALRSRFLS